MQPFVFSDCLTAAASGPVRVLPLGVAYVCVTGRGGGAEGTQMRGEGSLKVSEDAERV